MWKSIEKVRKNREIMKDLTLQRFFAIILLLLFMTAIIAIHSHTRYIKTLENEIKPEGKCECVHDSNEEKNVKLSLNNCLANYYPELQLFVNEDQFCSCICVRILK